MSQQTVSRRARVLQTGQIRPRPVTMVFGPGDQHRPLPLSVADMVEVRALVAQLDSDGIDRLVASWTMALVHLPPARPLDSLIPFLVDDVALTHTELSRRARNSLNRAGWWSLREVATASLAEVASARSVGSGSLTEFVHVYIRHALTGQPGLDSTPASGMLLEWLTDIVVAAQHRGATEIDIHAVARAYGDVSDRESLLGLPLPRLIAELQALGGSTLPHQRQAQR